MPPRLAALITAAGASSRMGRPKALVHWRGRPLLVHQIHVLAETCAEGTPIVAVLGAHRAQIRDAMAAWPESRRAILVDNPRWDEGRSATFEVGVAHFTELVSGPLPPLLVTAVDQPLEPAVVTRLIGAFDPASEVIVPVHGGRRGHPLVLAPRLVAELAHATRYPQGLRDIVRAAHAVREVEVDHAIIHADLNRPEDLGRPG